MGDTLQRLILAKYPTPIFAVTEFVLAFISLGPSPTFVPLVLLLATLRIHGARITFTQELELMFSWIAITAGSFLAYYSSATNVLLSSSQSLVAFGVMCAITNLCAIVIPYVDIRLSRQLQTTWAQITFFPFVWAMVWSVIPHISPVGRLLSWSPVSTSHPYGWLFPYTGSLGIDWAVAACAVLCSEVAVMLMGFDEEEVHMSTSASAHQVQSKKRSRSLLALGTLLAALTLPSLHVSPPARTDTLSDVSPLGVACALPSVREGRHPALGDFIAETRNLTSQAQVILWPESAVLFNSKEDREAAFEKLRKDIQQSLIGVAFEEFVPQDPSNPGGSRMRRNGLALVHYEQKKGEEVIQYYKQNLVPFTESFSVIPSTAPPATYTLELGPPKWATKAEWSSTPNHTRPIPITSSVCLDFAFSSACGSLGSRPALILAPAHTWDPTVGLAMWEQVKLRATEIGSMVLWCDGGATGVSGVGGGEISEIMRFGSGSWSRTIGLPHFPFRQRGTVLAVVGEISVLAFLMAIMGGGSVARYLQALASGCHSVLDDRIRTDHDVVVDVAWIGERQSLLRQPFPSPQYLEG
ncbi:hypothetical protein EDB19DRAFT_1901282 [Suillus lakei]|nr:hypothetical protein EDB19DRAFT_1901282 [Suillus lakei]